MTHCWCGGTAREPFGPQYARCERCGTLVSREGLPASALLVEDDEQDFYGKQYWLDHQDGDLGFPDIHARARHDLTERNLHWLATLLRYRLPPARTVEIGCAHASFVALQQWLGYQALGVEMSPWVVAFGRETFDVPVQVGPIEALDCAPGSFDVIALMDVLEHLPDPLATLGRCLELLADDGLLLIQTPQFVEDMDYETLVKDKDPFLQMLQADEHLFLFSRRSVADFFGRLGVEHLYFEPAIFAHYDMFFVASKTPCSPRSWAEVEATLLATPDGRRALALLDLRQRELALQARYQEAEADRAARGEQIEQLTTWLKASEADRAARLEQIETLTALLDDSRVRPPSASG